MQTELIGLAACVAAIVSAMPHDSWAQTVPPVNAGSPQPDCTADIARDPNGKNWPGYVIDDASGKVCVPFTANYRVVPEGYDGDYFVQEFTDAKLRAAWAACVASGPACADPVRKAATGFIDGKPFRATGSVDTAGRFDPDAEIDLKQVRRPGYFGTKPFSEAIAAAEPRTFTVEVTVPSDTLEHYAFGVPKDKTWKQRGWYMKGDGVPGADGKPRRVLVVMVGGRTIETTATHAAGDRLFTVDAATGAFVPVKYPTGTSEKWGAGVWRDYLFKLNAAGFDVLTMDKRGHGISGGINTSNTAMQARDIFLTLDALETGNGLRLLRPDGTEVAGAAAAGLLLDGQARTMPTLLGGASQGSMVVAHAMHMNFIGECDFDTGAAACGQPRGYAVIGAIALAEFVHGVGQTPRNLTEGYLRSEKATAYVPSGEVLAGISKWPALFIGRGLWDMAGGLESSVDAYRRANGPKDIVVVRGPHSEVEYGTENVAFMQDRMVAFALSVSRGDTSVAGATRFADLKALVASAPPFWEPSMRPATK